MIIMIMEKLLKTIQVIGYSVSNRIIEERSLSTMLILTLDITKPLFIRRTLKIFITMITITTTITRIIRTDEANVPVTA